MTYNVGELSPLKRHWIAKSANIPMRFFGFEPSDIITDRGSFPEEIVEWVNDVNQGLIIQNPGGIGNTGVGLMFDGAPGMGKTTHAVTTLMEVVRSLPEEPDAIREVLHYSETDFTLRARPIYYLTMTDLLRRKKAVWESDAKELEQLEIDGFHGRSKDDRFNVRVLLLDDLGKEYGSKYDDYSFDDILRSRYDAGLPTIVTTNVSLDTWTSKYGAVMSSFAHEAFRRVTIERKGDIRREGR